MMGAATVSLLHESRMRCNKVARSSLLRFKVLGDREKSLVIALPGNFLPQRIWFDKPSSSSSDVISICSNIQRNVS